MRTRYLFSFSLVAALVLQLGTLCFPSHAAPGDVDLSFDPGSGINGTVNAVAMQPDGKIIVSGEFTMVRGLARSKLARINADGSGDGSFNAGIPATNSPSALALQADGKLLAALGVQNGEGLTRLNPDGSQDTDFNVNATAAIDAEIAAHDPFYPVYITGIAVQPDGKLLVGGSWVLLRLNADGTLDPTFSGRFDGQFRFALQADGKVALWSQSTGFLRLNSDGSPDNSFTPAVVAGDILTTIVPQPDGKVLIGGVFNFVDDSNHSSIARLNADGSRDATFNLGVSPPPIAQVNAIAFQSGGKVLVGGQFNSVNGNARTNLARFNADGSLDSGFTAILPEQNTYGTGVKAIALQPDGKMFIAGAFTTVNGTNRNRLARLDANGSVDSSFDPGQSLDRWISGVAAQPDGKILYWGGNYSGYGAPIVGIGRLNSNGSRDGSFNPGTGVNYGIVSAALQPDGKVVIGGAFTFYDSTPRFGLARVNADGGLDDNFHPALSALAVWDEIPPGLSGYYGIAATSVLLQSNGKVLVAGYTMTTTIVQDEGWDTTNRYFLLRFHADGNPDASFTPVIGNRMHGSGFWWFDLVYYPGSGLALQSDGKILLSGEFSSLNGTTRYGIARLSADGNPDNTFNPDVGVSVGGGRLDVQPDGKILVGGPLYSLSATNRFGVVRLNASGTLDNTFNPPIGSNGSVSPILQADGRMILHGYMPAVTGTNGPGIARFNANGSLDNTFHPATGSNAGLGFASLQTDGNVLISGDFLTVNGVMRPYVARLYGDSQTPPSFAKWAAGYNLAGAVAAADADPDHDGLPNGVEYVLGENPLASSTTVPSTSTSPRPSVTVSGGTMLFTFQRDDASETPDVTVKVENGMNLIAWPNVFIVGADTAGSGPGVMVSENGTAPDTITVAIPTETTRATFARLKVMITP